MRALAIRPLTDEERKVIEQRATSRTAPAVTVRRAQLLRQMSQGVSAPQAAAAVGGVTGETARQLLKRVNQGGVKALADQPRCGRPPTLTEEDRGKLVLLLAQTPPQAGQQEAQGACHWTLDALLQAAGTQGIPIGRTRLWKVLHQEGIKW